MPSRQTSFTHQQSTKHRATFIFLVITVFSSVLILVGVLYVIYYVWYSLIHRTRTSPLDSSHSCPVFLKLRRYGYKELNSATNGFSDDNYIGKGGSGTVYRGILRNGKLVAVKVLDSDSVDAEREFQNELRILGGLESPFVVSLVGYCVEKRKRLVVYEYMPNRSLQESLFSDRSLNWERRFEIVVDVARALKFLHQECDPPVIHGDVKPSNVLLDTEFRAKLSDFGLSRLKIEPEFGDDINMFSQDLSGTLAGAGAGESPAIGTPVESSNANEVDFALALQASSSSTPVNSKVVCGRLGLGFMNEKGKDLSIGNNENCSGDDWINNKFTNYDDELGHNSDCNQTKVANPIPVEDHKSGTKKQWGKDWWWKQDGSGELSTKDYVREWIGSQICPSETRDSDDDRNSEKPDFDQSAKSSNCYNLNENRLRGNEEQRGWKQVHQHRKMQEWWKEEHLDELTNKKVETKIKRRFKLKLKLKLKLKFGLLQCKLKPNRHDHKSEFSFHKNSKNNTEMYSGDVFSRELSSTTSMRGTLCYVAPEYGGCEYLIDKTDVYSFGVLILVIVSGRRPLHVLASPMKLEKANLISWCRQLAQGGDLLELVDEKLKDEYNKSQASLCISLALACLQKMPELRPDIGDVVKILNGEMELPVVPFQFSPSPPSKLVGRSRSRRKNKSCAD